MHSALYYWLPLFLLLGSWEFALQNPQWLAYLFAACIVESVLFVLPLLAGRQREQVDYVTSLSIIVFLSGIFWWLLWVDLGLVKYVIPILLVIVVAKFFNTEQRVTTQARLLTYIGGCFFWAHITFGLVAVLGWDPWHAALIFLGAFVLLSGPLFLHEETHRRQYVLWAVFCLLVLEGFSVFVWLPFAEATLALLLTLCAAALFDFSKYMIDDALVTKKIVIKKILLYASAIAVLLVSTPWH